MSGFVEQACETIKEAVERRAPLRVTGGDTKAFYGCRTGGQVLSTAAHRGIVDYEPSELVVTVRAGTPLSGLEAELAEHGQMLPFEPPHFGEQATVGGTIAAGFSGPRRAAAGAARDAVLGCEIINGFGEHLAFGGQVMKNVAGYDIARLMVGALGTLGVITQVSMKVIPRPVAERTLVLELPQRRAIESMNKWAGLPLPVSATCHNGDKLYVRLSGARSGVDSAANKIGGETLEDASFWEALREQRHPFFRQATSLWRVALPPASPPLELTGRALVEWNGGLRWLATDDPPGQVRSAAAAAGGHATWFRGHDGLDVFHPLDEGRLALHRNLKRAFDPAGILNRGRMYPETI